MTMDLGTDYLGLRLQTPLVASASPCSDRVDDVRRMEEAGLSAVVLRSWFTGRACNRQTSDEPSLTAYLEHIEGLREAVDIPVIASLSGTVPEDWRRPARRMADAGASALELNAYYIPSDLDRPGHEIEDEHVAVVAAVVTEVDVPVAVKLGPFFTNTCNVARRLAGAGAAGLVLFNRFYQPDLELEERRTISHLLLSTENDLRLPLRWIGLLHGRIDIDFAATGGIRTGQDVMKMLAVGANVAMLCSAILEGGIARITAIKDELQAWMDAWDATSVRQLRGTLSQSNNPDAAAFERAQYIETLHSWRGRFAQS